MQLYAHHPGVRARQVGADLGMLAWTSIGLVAGAIPGFSVPGRERMGCIATMLVDAGANVNALVEDDETPLINAARRGHLDIVKYLVGKGADVSFSTIANKRSARERRSALSEAEKYAHSDVAEYLRANGATS